MKQCRVIHGPKGNDDGVPDDVIRKVVGGRPLDIDGIHCDPEGLAKLHCIPASGGAGEEIQNTKIGNLPGCIADLCEGDGAIVPFDVRHDMCGWRCCDLVGAWAKIPQIAKQGWCLRCE